MAKGSVLKFTREDGREATIAEYEGRVAIQPHADIIIRRKSIESAIAWLESRGYSIDIDSWRAFN